MRDSTNDSDFCFKMFIFTFFLKGKGEVMFGEVVGRVSGVAVGRAREGVALLLSGRLMRCVVEWKEVSSRLMWVRVKIERVGCLHRHMDRVVRRVRWR